LNITRVSTISLYGCSASGAYALGPHTKEEEETVSKNKHTAVSHFVRKPVVLNDKHIANTLFFFNFTSLVISWIH